MEKAQDNLTGLKSNGSWDKTWEKVFTENEWGKYPDIGLVRFVARNFYKSDRKNTQILEIGCGPGANVWFLAKEGFSAYGIDGSPTAINKAKDRMAAEGVKVDLTIGDIVSLPFEDNKFDAVLDCECLTHNSSDNLERILSEIKRVLKKDGLFFSRAFTDNVYLGKTQTKVGSLEFKNISDGPFAGRGFVRLMRRSDIDDAYGRHFKIISVDKSEYTQFNGEMNISEWIVVGRNEK